MSQSHNHMTQKKNVEKFEIIILYNMFFIY